MTWERLPGEAAKIKIHESGKITWNGAAHTMLEMPVQVELFIDEENNRLGLGKINYSNGAGSCFVQYTEGHEFEIEASEHLGAAGISVESVYIAAPNVPIPPGQPPDLGDRGIVWIELP